MSFEERYVFPFEPTNGNISQIEGKTPEETLAAWGVEGADLLYATALYEQFLERRAGRNNNLLCIGENFIPSAMLSPKERADLLGVVDYEDIIDNPLYNQGTQDIAIEYIPMQGGIGSNVGRLEHLKRIWHLLHRTGSPALSAKGLDLTREQDGHLFSVMEVNTLLILSDSPHYGAVSIRPLLNPESEPSFGQFLAMQAFGAPAGVTYEKAIMQSPRRFLPPPLVQGKLPSIDANTGELTIDHKAPGGHGQGASMLLYELSRKPLPNDNLHHVAATFNGEGFNNFASRPMIEFVVRQSAGVALITTTRTEEDIKGGIIGVAVHEGDSRTVDIMEIAQAKQVGQQQIFHAVGLKTTPELAALGLPHFIGEQYFNTNGAIYNETLLTQLLTDLLTHTGAAALGQITTPELIENLKNVDGKPRIQLEGASASVLLKLAAFVNSNEYAKQRWSEISGGKPFLRIINLNQTRREEFFTQIKYPLHYWLQACTDHYILNTNTWQLQNTRPGHTPRFNHVLTEEEYFKEIQHFIDTFGNASVVDLEELTMEGLEGKQIGGHVKMERCIMRGKVIIQNASEGCIDLNSEEFSTSFPREDGRLVLEDTRIVINEQGNIMVTSIS